MTSGNPQSRRPNRLNELEQRLNTQVKTNKLRDKRYLRLIDQLGGQQQLDHDALAALQQKFDKLEANLQKGRPEKLAFAVSGFTPDEVKQILSLQEQDDVNDLSTVVTGVVGTLDSMKKEIDVVVDAVAETRGMANEHAQRLDNHDARLDKIDGADGQLSTLRNALYIDLRTTNAAIARNVNQTLDSATVEEESGTSRGKKIGVSVAALTTFLLVWLITWFVGGTTTAAVTQQGKTVGTATLSLHYGWIGFFLGLIAAALVIVFGLMLGNRSFRLRFNHLNAGNDVQNQPPAVSDDTPTEQFAPVSADDRDDEGSHHGHSHRHQPTHS